MARSLEKAAGRMGGSAHVAIDGPAGSGKTTVARTLAPRLGLLYLDTGAMYRALADAALLEGVPIDDEAAVVRLARAQPIEVVLDSAAPSGSRICVGGRAVDRELYRNEVSTVVSIVAAYAEVRSLMIERQRAIAGQGAVVMAGRDIGTVVLPEAPVKIFLTASLEARVDRRAAELAGSGRPVDRDELRSQMLARDRLDETRAIAPLRAAADALTIDSTALSVEQVVDRIAERAERPSANS